MTLTGPLRVSIVTPVFNAVRYVEACVRNVAGQGEVVLEHLIVDGGSTDGTVELVERLAREFPHVRLLPGPDRGQSDAMNKGSEAARGEVIGMLNVDDDYQPGAVAEAAEFLGGQPGPAFVAGDCKVVDADGRTLFWNRPIDLRLVNLLTHNFVRPIPANPSAYFYHRSVHDIVGGFDIDNHLAMDVDFVLAAAARVPMHYLPRHWGNFHLLPGSKSFENRDKADPVAPLLAIHRARLARSRRLQVRLVRLRVDAGSGWRSLRDRARRRLARMRPA